MRVFSLSLFISLVVIWYQQISSRFRQFFFSHHRWIIISFLRFLQFFMSNMQDPTQTSDPTRCLPQLLNLPVANSTELQSNSLDLQLNPYLLHHSFAPTSCSCFLINEKISESILSLFISLVVILNLPGSRQWMLKLLFSFQIKSGDLFPLPLMDPTTLSINEGRCFQF